jgi:hypothetical protein
MLAAIEHGMVRRIVDAPASYAFYTVIPRQVWRVAGLDTWYKHQYPRYALDADGTVHAAGFFEERKPLALQLGGGQWVAWKLSQSAIWRRLDWSRVTAADIGLCLSVVRRSRDLLAAQYPGIEFRIISWPGSNAAERSVNETLLDGFRHMGITVDVVDDILPGYTTDATPFVLSSFDHHPSALANRLLARHVLNKIESGQSLHR